MRINNRYVLKMIIPALLLLLVGCGSNETADKSDQEFVRIADNLYETVYTEDFDWNRADTPALPGFACSGVQNGIYRGRNYDWTYADTDICIIHATATADRPHASVGVSDLSFAVLEDGSIDREKAPFVTVDGINDAGVCIQVNVLPFGENGPLSHTETREDDLAGSSVVRYILDNADSVDAAVSLLKEKDIHPEMADQDELHWLISGPAGGEDSSLKTIVVEVFPDGLHITEDFVNGKPIMTNMNVSNFDGTAQSVGLGFGYERWQILDRYYDQADSVMGTFDLMEKVYFTKSYDLYIDNFWYSEYNGKNLCDYYDEDSLKEMLGEDTYYRNLREDGAVCYTPELWDGEKCLNGDSSKAGIVSPIVEYDHQQYRLQNEDGSLWLTIHTSVYDLENRTLDIQVRESQDHLHFSIEK